MTSHAAARVESSPSPPPPTPLPLAPTPIRQEPAPVEHETAPLKPAAEERITDAFKLLDHRTRARAISSERMARRGPHLAFQDGEDTKLIPLETKVTHIGRSVASDLRIEEHRVSRSHAILVKHGRYARVLDNRSSNGTFVNGRRIVATNLSNGDVICVGAVAMQYLELG